ncbi:type I 3-dehydroquinate dehydratase [Paucisalibacillus globulus]|uniref:type I 3-dehydroquinate dehydratase n=1 Tax=Paucisalibacillus globulus TaxID=351095 RepID=UPI000408B919|nr:type I 3-dehydroquinate dehydratase [Paucisalibacillus globulus]
MIKVRNVSIGQGIPKIIVPLIGSTDSELVKEVHHVMGLKPDIVEWRVDTYAEVGNLDAVQGMLSNLRDILVDKPILFTFRSFNEGGKREASVEFYQKLIKMAIQSKLIDLVDMELFLGDDLVTDLVCMAKENGIYIVMSNHDFHKTPKKEEIISRLRKMQELGADIPKIAVMPNNTQDVITLLDASNTMKEKYSDRPFITVSMGEKGVVSRLTGEVFGSAATFGSGRESSAPGQIDVMELSGILNVIHKNLEE